jgi:hypothetical protein
MAWRHMEDWKYGSAFLDLGTRWRWVVSFMLLQKEPSLPIGGGGEGWLGSTRYGLDTVEKRKLCTAGNQTWIIQHWLIYPEKKSSVCLCIFSEESSNLPKFYKFPVTHICLSDNIFEYLLLVCYGEPILNEQFLGCKQKGKKYYHYFLILPELVTHTFQISHRWCRNIHQNVNNIFFACIWADMKDGLLESCGYFLWVSLKRSRGIRIAVLSLRHIYIFQISKQNIIFIKVTPHLVIYYTLWLLHVTQTPTKVFVCECFPYILLTVFLGQYGKLWVKKTSEVSTSILANHLAWELTSTKTKFYWAY